MPNKKAQDDDLVMSLVELALAQPPEQREAYLNSACAADTELFSQVSRYVESEQRMEGFLLDPLCPRAEPEHPFEPGQLLNGRFRILREVAEGGMGIVYEAYDETLERRIAIKCAKAGFRRRLPPEVRHASEIAHANVCKIFEIHTASTQAGEVDFITMEFLDGETLADRLSRGPLPKEEARTIARQLSAGLAEAHRGQVIHGDLKSNNVILSTLPDGAIRAVITDFGLARRPAAPSVTAPSGTRAGTAAYMAPELWKGEKASAASDVYAMGVILYELASGHKPPEPPDIESAPAKGPIRKLPPVDPRWDGILARCLDPNPSRRLSAAELAQALAPPVSRRWWLTAAVAAVLALATGAAVYMGASLPKESWRLAMLPVESSPETRSQADRLSRETAAQLSHLKGGNVARLAVIPLDRIQGQHIDTPEKAGTTLGATHVLHATLENKNGKLLLRAVLTDVRRRVNVKQWTAEYAPDELRYAPVALAGVVTSQLGLPPLVAWPTVNSAAAQDYWHGLWYMRRNSTIDSALPLLERAVAEDPGSPLTHAALAEAQQRKWAQTQDLSWLERAKESERQAQQRNPDLAQVQRVAGLLDVREGHYDLSASECLRAIALDPKDGKAYRVLGRTYETANRPDEALAAYRKAIEVDPGDYRNHQELGTFYYHLADYERALPHFLKAKELAPEEPVAHRVLGNCYVALGRLPDAEGEFRLAIQSGGTLDSQYLGLAFMEEGRYSDAVASYLQVLGLAPNLLVVRMNLGTAYWLMSQKVESRKAYRRARELAEKQIANDPSDGLTRSYLAYICARLGDSPRAESEIAQAQAQSPNDADVRFMAVATFEALDRRADSLEILGAVPYEELRDVKGWPGLADLSRDPRFIQLLASRKPNK